MRPGINIDFSSADRLRLEALVRDRNTAQKHVWRARIVLLSAAGMGTNVIMRETGKSKAGIWRGCVTGVSPQAEASPLSSAGAGAGTAELSSERDFRRP